jgi:hypothetical protein
VAQGYCYHFGALWLPSSSTLLERRMELLNSTYSSYSPALKWLLRTRGFTVPSAQQQREDTVTA